MEEPFLRTDAGAAPRVQMGALDGTPVPLTVTLCGLPAALLVSVTEPKRVPVAVGVKVIFRLHEPPAARLPLQLFVTAKTGIEGRMLTMLSAAPPVLVNRMVLAGLVVPMC